MQTKYRYYKRISNLLQTTRKYSLLLFSDILFIFLIFYILGMDGLNLESINLSFYFIFKQQNCTLIGLFPDIRIALKISQPVR